MRREAPSSLYRSGETFHLDLKARIGKDCRLYQIFQAPYEVAWGEYKVWVADRAPNAPVHAPHRVPSRHPQLRPITQPHITHIPRRVGEGAEYHPPRHVGDRWAGINGVTQTSLGMSG